MSWLDRQTDLARLAQRQLFFIGGAPRSGTTWLQQMLDSHPDVSCQGEGLFMNNLAMPLETVMGQRSRALESKNSNVFGHTGGYPLPPREDVEFLIGTAVLLALRQQSARKDCTAVGEKTPENIFFFPRLKQLFPTAKLIAIARDPRDVLTSAWHFFHKSGAHENKVAAKTTFIRNALPSLEDAARRMIAISERHPQDCTMVTYERLQSDRVGVLTSLCHFLGVSEDPAIVRECVARTDFAILAGGRTPGVEQDGNFLRKGVVGDWTSTLTPEMNDMVLHKLGWMFPRFGWQP